MREITYIIAIVAVLFAWVPGGHAQEPVKIDNETYRHSFDAASVQHPERIYIVWQTFGDARLEFLLPHEQDRSGVANILLKDRASGNVRLLDTLTTNLDHAASAENTFYNVYGMVNLNKLTHLRQSNRFEPGNYDVILLYNNGKYLVYDNLVITRDMKMVIDMASLPVQKADRHSREWLKLRKFTDVVGGARSVIKPSPAASPYKIAGYMFYWRDADSEWPVFRFAEPDKFASRVSEDGYFEVDLPRNDTLYALHLYYFFSMGDDYDELDAKAGTWLFCVRGEEWPLKRERPKVGGEKSIYLKDRIEHKFTPDTTWLWHPEQFHIAVPDMKVDFIFPYEKEQSGVANLLFRDRKSGEIRLLDYYYKTPYGGRRYAPFDPGDYDVILLYNNGKYIIRENLIFEPGVKMVVDISSLSARNVDEDSRQWLNQRKFTDMLGDKRILRSYYKANDSRHKISGYILAPDGAHGTCSVRLPAEVRKEVLSSRDGYFEFDYEDKDVGLTLRVSDDQYNKDVDIELTPNSGYFIVLEPIIAPTPKIIEQGSR